MGWLASRWILPTGFGVLTAIGLAPQLGEALEKRQPLAVARADWRYGSFPVENFQAYTSPFGTRHNPFGGTAGEFHGGLDIAAPQGSYVRNWWVGRVIHVSDHTGCGTMIRVQSGSWVHSYCHLKGQVERDNRGEFLSDRPGGIQIREGQWIPTGVRIGRVGLTGRTTGPHLCWRLQHNGQPVNPAVVLKAMFTAQRQR